MLIIFFILKGKANIKIVCNVTLLQSYILFSVTTALLPILGLKIRTFFKFDDYLISSLLGISVFIYLVIVGLFIYKFWSYLYK